MELKQLKLDIEKNDLTIKNSKKDLDGLKRESKIQKQHFEKEFASVFKTIDFKNRQERIQERFPNKKARGESASPSPVTMKKNYN